MKSSGKSGEIFLCVWVSQQNPPFNTLPPVLSNFGFQCLFGQKQHLIRRVACLLDYFVGRSAVLLPGTAGSSTFVGMAFPQWGQSACFGAQDTRQLSQGHGVTKNLLGQDSINFGSNVFFFQSDQRKICFRFLKSSIGHWIFTRSLPTRPAISNFESQKGGGECTQEV